ncbi:MAG: hypothetical protein MK319_08995 [Pseudomonadales bacterium]|jgi:hypothetical protein|nr:hypothetical protein [Pseudomonadales bacterium]
MVELDVSRGEFSDTLSFTSESIEFRPPAQTIDGMKDGRKLGKNFGQI